jgi:hypothetical protein
MDRTRRNERPGTEWKIGMEMEVWKYEKLMMDKWEKETVKNKWKKETVKRNPWTGPEVSRRLRLPDFKSLGT